jgi:DNA-binding response OmpR family regulator
MDRERRDPPQTGSRFSSRILVVDDEPVMRRMIDHALTSAGHWCATASTGGEAVELLRYRTFDLSVIDKNLPDISGIEVARRTRDLFRKVPVIIVTGFPSDESRQEAEALGVASYMVKPFDVEALRDEVNEALDDFWRVSREPIAPRPSQPATDEVPTRPPPRARPRQDRFSTPPAFEEPRRDLDVTVIVVEPDDELRALVATVLQQAGCRVTSFRSRFQAEIRVRHDGYDVLVTRPELIASTGHWVALAPGEPPLGTIALVDSESVDRHIEAIQAGARGILTPPFAGAGIIGRFAAAVDSMREERDRVTVPPPDR